MRRIWTKWLVLAAFLLAVNCLGLALALRWKATVVSERAFPHRQYEFVHQRLYDGSRITFGRDLSTGTVFQVRVITPATVEGTLCVWAPLIASLAMSACLLAIVGSARVRAALVALRKPRLTMIQGMALIGAVALMTWLSRFAWVVLSSGTVVLCLMLFTSQRRGALAREIRGDTEVATAWSKLTLIGYSIAVLLALAWVGTILVWDAYQQGRN